MQLEKLSKFITGPDQNGKYRVNVEGLAKELDLLQESNIETIQEWVDQAFATNEKAVKDALANPKKQKAAVGFLRGQVMKLSAGKADPKLVGELIEKKIDESRQRTIT